MVDCSAWAVTSTFSTKNWPEGLYLLKLLGADGMGKYIPLTLRSASTTGRLVLINATATYQAYNTWGGYSLYTGPGGFGDRAHVVSFNRPYDRSGARYVTAGEREITAEAERLGLPLAYETSTDLDTDPHVLHGALGVVSPNHDEYMSNPMRSAYLTARDSGTNLAFMGANAEYWRVRFGSNDRQMIGYKSAALDPMKNSPSTTALWRDAPYPRPENQLTGLMYECFPAQGPLRVTDPHFFLFAHTGATDGATYPGLVGVEIDRAYPIAGTPASLEVAAHSPVQCGAVGPTFSDFAYYTTKSGAGVVATGTMQWAVGITQINNGAGITARSSQFATTVTANLLHAMAAGPMGKDHPAHPNLTSLHANPSARTGTGNQPDID